MCGIIARIGEGNAVGTLLSGLSNLEYRGYDSAGIAVKNGHGLDVRKQSGRVNDLEESVEAVEPTGNFGIGHTRWSTHGPPTDENAHPHTNTAGDVAVVHNGVIENYTELRAWLQERGHEFVSDTDTEVVPHLFSHYLRNGTDPTQAFRRTIDELDGSYAIAAIVDGQEAVFAARNGSPLVLGLGDEEYFLASDVPAFLEQTDRVVYFEDGDVAVIRKGGVEMMTLDGTPVDRDIETVDWDPEETGKGEYDHYMLKEIYTQPNALANTIRGRIDPETGEVTFEDFPTDLFEDADDVHFVACGTSYHAALYGAQLLNEGDVRAQAFRASEYLGTSGPITEDTLVIAVTQSGETADTLGALRGAAEAGASTIAVTNVVGSTAAREVDHPIFIRAGPEIGVAATKTFSSQVVTLSLLAQRLLQELPQGSPLPDLDRLLADLDQLPDLLEELLASTPAERIARQYMDSEAFFFIGRGLGYPVALEGALKFKEITYEHAEGFASGELKHGPLALVTRRTPVISVFTGEDRKTLTNATEAQARGADILAVCPDDHPAVERCDTHLSIPDVHPVCAGLLANVQLQLLSYHAANRLDRAIDKPRNLAKSVTVE